MKRTKEEQEAARERLREQLPEGSTVVCVLRHRNRRSGTAAIDLYRIPGERDGHVDVRWLSYNAAILGVGRWSSARECLLAQVVGMDQGFHLVSTLSRALYGRSDALRHQWLG